MLSMYPGNRKMNIILMYLEINVFFSTFQEVTKKKKRIYISHAYRSSATVDQNVSWDFVFCEAVPGFHFINGLYLLGHKPKNITSDITF